MSSTELTWSSFLRITSISVAAYDYLITIPAELRMYRSQGSLRFGWSLSKILFIMIRYVSIILLIVSDFGYFYHGFSAAACSTYFMAAPVLKVIQIMISQVIIGYRTWAITRRSKPLGIFLLTLGLIVTALEWYANVDGRIPVQEQGNCSPGNSKTGVPQWVFYLMAMLFDSVTCILSTFFLVRSANGFGSVFSTSLLVKVLFYDGLGYMVTLTAVNVLNLILYRNSVGKNAQSSGAAFGYMIVWIMSQQILIHIHEAAEEHNRRRIFVSHQASAPRDVSYAMRNQFSSSTKEGTQTINEPIDVQVQIEQAVTVDYDPVYSREEHQGEKPATDPNQQWELSSVTSGAQSTHLV